MNQLLTYGLLGIILLIVLVILTAIIVGLVHAIKRSIRERKRPPLPALIGWALWLLLLIVSTIIENVLPSHNLYIFFLGKFQSFWSPFILRTAFAVPVLATGYYVLASYIYPPVSADDEETDEDMVDEEDEDEDDDEDEDEEDEYEARYRLAAQEKARSQSRVGAILSGVVTIVVLIAFFGCMVVVDYMYSTEHVITEVQSAKDDRVVYIDKLYLNFNGTIVGEGYAAYVYERISPFLVARLECISGEDVERNLTYFEEDEISRIEWTETGLKIPFGNKWIEYQYYEVTSN